MSINTTESDPVNTQATLDPPTTSASAPKLPLSSPPSSNKRKRPFKRDAVKPQANQTGKRVKASFAKSEVAKHVAYTTVIYTAYDLETSFRGLLDLCSIFYTILTNRDQKIANLITAQHFQYVTLLAIIYRCQLIASNSTTTLVRGLSYLKESVEKILLPELLCQYVETVGYCKMSTGITVIPYIRNYTTMKRSLDFIDPVAILAQMDKPDPGTDWGVDDETILEYKRAISRVVKNAIQLRMVNNLELEAKPEFLGCYELLPDLRVLPFAFEQMNASQCTYGAVMKFRDVGTQRDWEGITPPVVQETKAVDCNTFITDLILHYLRDSA